MKKLILMRHAAAIAIPVNGDSDRILKPIGIEQAEISAEFVMRFKVDKMLISSAKRTTQTAEIVAKKFPHILKEIKDELYQASSHRTLQLIAQQDNDIKTLMIIGHNPTMYNLILSLSDYGSLESEEYEQALQRIMPPAGVAVIDFPGANIWAEIVNDTGKLKQLWYPNNEE